MTNLAPLSAEELARRAQHECGHAVARWAQGIPFLRILLGSPAGPMVYPVPGTRVLLGQRCLIQACDFIADYQRRGLRMRDSQIAKLLLGGGDDDRFEVDDPATGQVAVRPSRAPAVAPGGDMSDWTALIAATRPPPAECIGLWRDCEGFAAACRPAIDAVAAELLARTELGYADASEIAAAMAGKPPPTIPKWARPGPSANRW